MNECDSRTNLQLKYNWYKQTHQTQKNIAQEHIAQEVLCAIVIVTVLWIMIMVTLTLGDSVHVPIKDMFRLVT